MTYAKLKELSSEAFRRYSGVKLKTFEAMPEVLEQAEGQKEKAGRPSKLRLEEQLLPTLTYWRKYRTQFHVALSYGVHETTATRIIGKVEDTLTASGRFKLPKREALRNPDHEWVVVLIDSTETPIEQPKKSSRLAKLRIGVEHVICWLKRFRILKERYRNRRKRFGLRSRLIAGLHNFELALA